MMQHSKMLNMMHAQALKHIHLNTCDMKCMKAGQNPPRVVALTEEEDEVHEGNGIFSKVTIFLIC